ncbi:universal stress protein [Croceicoccus ponticola]|uniref:Universal stress protein n=1 Tax=Croceicoccus ponticola TaxID=2217664 RepID=A0A437H263_9SPHN|nr:universal stress protein [Croceicoccus ponticola]RVQ69602.1 universal stress protein [Croceicoccus ponticola]
MKNILLLVHDDTGQEARLQVALDVTRALNGHLECLDVMALPMIISDYYADSFEATVMVKEQEREGKNVARLTQRLATEDVAWSMGETYGTLVEAMIDASQMADLIVVSARLGDDADEKRHARPERLPLASRRPILAVPPQCRGMDATGTVVVAWDGSRAGNEALRAAVPLLTRANEVVLLEVNQPEGAFAMKDAATYLSRHGIAADLVERETRGAVADVILKHAENRNAAFIVMGAYGTPSVAEAVFGGVTRTMLSQSPIPLFVAH